MSFYTVALFFHIVGAIGVFVAFGLEWMGLRRMRQAATVEQIREGARIIRGMRWLIIASMIDLVIFGGYMMMVARIGAAWLIVAFWALILLAILGIALTGRRVNAIIRMAATEEGKVSLRLYSAAHHPVLWLSVQTRVAVALGIVFLMTVKPDLLGALLVIGATIALGLASALLTQGSARPQASALQ
jgi:hypothetical protein